MNRRLRTDPGKRAGVASGLLGVLCVLAQFAYPFTRKRDTPYG